MLLALNPPGHNPIDVKPPHDYPLYGSKSSRYSPPESPRNFPRSFEGSRMNNSHSHRGLPPLPTALPGSLSLPPPDRGHPTAPAPLGHLPAPPSQWAGQDESMRSWLHAKAEEDRRKQEEERTRQEGLRLDQRRVEQDMLRESLQGGIPPPMVPLIFAGIGGGNGNLPGHTLEWAQQYLASMTIQSQQQQQQIQAQQQQLQQQQSQQQQPPSPDAHRDSRLLPSNPYTNHPSLQQVPASQTSAQTQNSQGRGSLSGPPPGPTALSRINTTDYVPSSSSGPTPRAALHPLQQAQTGSSEPSSGPGLFFHHWTPPSTSSAGAGVQPPTPSGKSAQTSPFSQHAASHLRSEYQNSPKKRKATTGQAIAVPPTSQPPDAGQPMSSRSSGERELSPGGQHQYAGHHRHLSDASLREQEMETRNIARPSSRQQRAEETSGTSGSGPRRQLTGSSTSASSEDSNAFRYQSSRTETS